MVVDAGAVLHFLQVNHVLLFLRRPRRLRLLELELPVVHDLDDGGAGSRSHFHEIQPAIQGGGQRLLYGQNAELLTLGADDPHRTDANHAVDADSLFALVRGQWSCLRRQKKTGTLEITPGARTPRPAAGATPAIRLGSQDPVALRLRPAGSGWGSFLPA